MYQHRAGHALTCVPPHLHEAVFAPRADTGDHHHQRTQARRYDFDPSSSSAPISPPHHSPPPQPRRLVVQTLASAQHTTRATPLTSSWPASSSPVRPHSTATPVVIDMEPPRDAEKRAFLGGSDNDKDHLPLAYVPGHGQTKAKRWYAKPGLYVIGTFVVCILHFAFLRWLDTGAAASFGDDLVSSLNPYTPDHSNAPTIPADWYRRCAGLLPVPKGTYTGRLDKLAATLDGDAWVAEPGASVEYFIGAFSHGVWKPSERPFLIAVTEEGVTLLTPAFEEGRAKLIPLLDEVKGRITWLSWTESESPYEVLVQHLGRKHGIVLDGGVRTFVADGLLGAQKKHGVAVTAAVDKAAAAASLRERKDEREIGLMRCANEATLSAIRKTRAQMYIGISESQTREILYKEMGYAGLSDYSALILFGPNAALPHGSGTDRTLLKDEFVLIDAGGRWGGYLADITRTFPLPESEISDEHREVWEIVRAAQRAPANLLHLTEPADRPQFSWLDDRARETVKRGMAALGVPPQKGHKPDYTVFTHRLGHGIGLEGHESPYVVQGDLGERTVLAGHTVTFEPGVYIPSDSSVGDESIRGLGVRLEDVVVVREEHGRLKAEFLTGPVEHWGDV